MVRTRSSFGLLDSGERFAELRIVRALRPQLLLGAFELGLGLSDAGLGRLDLRRGLVRAGFGVDALLNELEDARRLVRGCCRAWLVP